MSRIFISGSTTGLGLTAGELLASQGHRVVLHARNADRAEDARRALPKAPAVASECAGAPPISAVIYPYPITVGEAALRWLRH